MGVCLNRSSTVFWNRGSAWANRKPKTRMTIVVSEAIETKRRGSRCFFGEIWRRDLAKVSSRCHWRFLVAWRINRAVMLASTVRMFMVCTKPLARKASKRLVTMPVAARV